MQKALRIADNLPHIYFVMGMGLAPELDAATAFQKKYWAMLKNCAKPQVLISEPDIEDETYKKATLIQAKALKDRAAKMSTQVLDILENRVD